MTRASYELARGYRQGLIGAFAFLLILGLAVLARVVDTPPALAAIVVWLVVIGAQAYRYLFRVAYRLELADGLLHWRAPMIGGTVAVADLVRVRPAPVLRATSVLETASGQRVQVLVRKGYSEFVGVIEVPDVVLRSTRWSDQVSRRTRFSAH